MPKFTATDRPAIKAALRSHGVTQDDLAEACLVAKTTISVWLSGDISSPALDKAIPAYMAGLSRGVELSKAA